MQTQTLYRFDAYNGDGIYWRTLPNGPWRGPFPTYNAANADRVARLNLKGA
jgi:hypothetical protein